MRLAFHTRQKETKRFEQKVTKITKDFQGRGLRGAIRIPFPRMMGDALGLLGRAFAVAILTNSRFRG
jgi:hypothetical protein